MTSNVLSVLFLILLLADINIIIMKATITTILTGSRHRQRLYISAAVFLYSTYFSLLIPLRVSHAHTGIINVVNWLLEQFVNTRVLY